MVQKGWIAYLAFLSIAWAAVQVIDWLALLGRIDMPMASEQLAMNARSR
jgi:hypothetical protein